MRTLPRIMALFSNSSGSRGMPSSILQYNASFIGCGGMISVKPKKNVVFVLGAPGSGKGAVCSDIAKEFNFTHLSAGALIREEQNRPNSKYAELIKDHIIAGDIIPGNITCGLLERAMNLSNRKNFLIDGFPRNSDNLSRWSDTMAEQVQLLFVLFLECPEEVCISRCLKRGLEEGRSDDNERTFKHRFHVFLQNTRPIIRYYEEQDELIHVRSDRKREEVFEDVAKVFEENGFQRRKTIGDNQN